MDQQFIPTTKPSIEDIHHRFEQWREIRKHRTPIPKSLWEGAVSLCADHSIYKISRSLSLDYNALKRRVCYSHPESLPEPVMSSAFVELDLKASLPEAECLVEIDQERFHGTCCLAANWIYIGKTTGRGKNDQTHKVTRSIKGVWGYPLSKEFRFHLCGGQA